LASVEFKYAYAPRTGTDQSFLRVYASTDCGKTWVLRWISGGASLATAPAISGPYTNPQLSHWVTKTFNIPASQINGNLRMKFELKTENGNNLFVDDININGTFSDVVVLKYPLDGSTGLSLAETLDWNATSQADFYTVEMDTTPNFSSSMLIQQQVQYISSNSQDIDTEFLTQGLSNGLKYYWRVRSEKTGQTNAWSDTWNFTVNVNGLGKDFAVNTDVLVNVYPNPALQNVFVNLKLAQSENIEISVFDITGTLVQNSFTGFVSSGESTIEINRTGWSNGIYLIQVKSSSSIQTIQVILN
jgi:hypothetical protein